MPKCLTAQYEKNSWDNLKTDVVRFDCDECGCPPPPPIDSASKSGPLKVCGNCDHVNRKPIGLQTEIFEMQKKEEAEKKMEEKNALKRSAPPSEDKEETAEPPKPVVTLVAPKVVVKRRRTSPPRQMARKVVPQVARMERERARMAREAAMKQNNQKSPVSSKKPKLVTEKEPEFLQQLFGIGAKPSN